MGAIGIENSVNWRVIMILAGIFALRMLGLLMILPIFSVLANELIDVTPTLIGIALGIYGLTQALFQLPFGMLSDYLGRKPVIVLGFLMLAVGSLVAAFSTSIYGVIVGRCLQGAGAVGSVILALVTDLTPENRRTRAMAVMGVTIGLSFALAIVLGPLFAGWWGLQGVFMVTAFFPFVAIVLLVTTIPTPLTPIKDNKSLPLIAYIPSTLKNKALLRLNIGALVLHATLTALFLKVPVAVQGFGLVEASASGFYLLVFFCSIVATAPVILLIERRGQIKAILALAVLGLAVSEIGMWIFFHSFRGFAVSLWLFFTAFNVLEASLPSLVSKYAETSCRGTALGMYSSLQFLGLFIGGAVGGWLDGQYGMVAVGAFCVILAMGWLISIFR